MSAVTPQVKGLQILGMVKTLRARRKEALALLRPQLHHYLTDRIMVSSWYPEEDHLGLILAVGQMLSAQMSDPWRFIGEQGAKGDLSGLYASMLRPGDPAASLQRMKQSWALYHNTGDMRVIDVSAKNTRVELHGFRGMAAESARVNAGYLCGIARAAGASNPEAEVLPRTGPDLTVWNVTWR